MTKLLLSSIPSDIISEVRKGVSVLLPVFAGERRKAFNMQKTLEAGGFDATSAIVTSGVLQEAGIVHRCSSKAGQYDSFHWLLANPDADDEVILIGWRKYKSDRKRGQESSYLKTQVKRLTEEVERLAQESMSAGPSFRLIVETGEPITVFQEKLLEMVEKELGPLVDSLLHQREKLRREISQLEMERDSWTEREASMQNSIDIQRTRINDLDTMLDESQRRVETRFSDVITDIRGRIESDD